MKLHYALQVRPALMHGGSVCYANISEAAALLLLLLLDAHTHTHERFVGNLTARQRASKTAFYF